MQPETKQKQYIPWVIVGLMDFVTVIGFDDIIYNFQNQGLVAVTSWVLMTFFYVIPYNLIVAHMGSTFSEHGGGITSWMRQTNGDTVGYFAAWFYWITGLPYVVDVANSVVISFGWILNGNGNIQANLGNAWFGILTAVIFVLFIWIQHFFKNKSLEVMSTIGGGAMFIMTILFVVMTFAGLAHGDPIATHPFHFSSFMPKDFFSLSFLSTFGLFVFAMNGSELAAPYTADMRHPAKDFPKALKMIAIMTMFLTLFGTFSLGVYFNAHHLPNDLKMNGSYYAFQAIGRQFGLGNGLMYLFAVVQGIYMLAQLAVILDASTRVFLSDVAKRFMPRQLTKKTADGLPINGYWLTTILCALIMALGGLLPKINDIFNWLLNLNGIVSPFSTCFLFWSYIMVRRHADRFPTPAYRFIKSDKLGLIVGLWMLIITFLLAVLGFFPTDANEQTFALMLTLNIVVPIGMVVLGVMMPWIAKRQAKGNAFGRGSWWLFTGILLIVLVSLASYGIATNLLAHAAGALRVVTIGIVDLLLIGVILKFTANGRHGTTEN
ncbi:APC family permease [Lacticaseibacillus baoqingensis]|uniref:APC family permease n=1 Tax=Lacticaseibacillus baoqingensis TaxID=2486013 RepID=A0ABW4E1M8_9LACO|nr:amino acid permease [Lacticaseibacillus baoqingensis]